MKRTNTGTTLFLVSVDGSDVWEEHRHVREVDLIEDFLEELIQHYSQLKQRQENEHIIIEEVRYRVDCYQLRVRGEESFIPILDEHKVSLFYYLAQFINIDVQ